jgi:probable F420-dependent oxidoreductase
MEWRSPRSLPSGRNSPSLSRVKVRIGVGAGGSLPAAGLGNIVDALGEHGFDSLWLSEVLTAPVIDPLVGLAWAAARSPQLKLGTTMLLPGRNPIRLAKELATLDAVSGGRLLITFVPGLAQPPERDAIGVSPSLRSAQMEEMMPLLRRLWAGETVTHRGDTASFDDVTLAPLPVQQPLEMWLGGMVPAALERCGRLSDGWLPSLCTPEQAAAGREAVEVAASRADRKISEEHFGVSVGYARAPLDDRALQALASRSRGQDPKLLVPVGLESLRGLLERFINVGFSKFVVRPTAPPVSWDAELADLASAVLDLQT